MKRRDFLALAGAISWHSLLPRQRSRASILRSKIDVAEGRVRLFRDR
jgi:hypothetical protein